MEIYSSNCEVSDKRTRYLADSSACNNGEAQPDGNADSTMEMQSRVPEQQLPSQPCKDNTGWRRLVRNFTPSWFAVSMGTGIVSILLHQLPYQAHWLQILSYVTFALNVALFVCFFLISIMRYVMWPEIWKVMIAHSVQSLFLGCVPMALATIVNMICYVCVSAWPGNVWWKVAWALWWIDVSLATATCCWLPFAIMAIHKRPLQTMTAAWLLPVVSTIVAAASGSIVATILPSSKNALITLIASYTLWGMGESLAFMILTIYFLRLTVHTLPPKEVIVSTLLPLGPLGQGGFAVQNLGNVARQVIPSTHTLPASVKDAGDALYVAGWLIGLIMWGFGLVWFFFAVAAMARTSKIPFNMGWWGFTFPLGVYAICTLQLAKETPSDFFRVLGTIFSVAVILLWLIVSAGTMWMIWTGEANVAPCLNDLTSQRGNSAQRECEVSGREK